MASALPPEDATTQMPFRNGACRRVREHAMPKIRHLAIVCMDPEKLAQFYCEVFDMTVVGRNGRNGRHNVFVSDGYITVALLSQKAEGKPYGLNHFGFQVEDSAAIAERMKDWKVVGPAARPADRTYAELRATDPEGNNFDLAEGGFERGQADGNTHDAPATA
jgi:catechol 2,3-dioxygenase-like lactoylglutathione lyase family enzyme